MTRPHVVTLLLRWLTLPVHPADLGREHDALVDALLDSPERETAHAHALGTLLAATTGEEPPPGHPAADDLGTALSLLTRAEAAAIAAARSQEEADARGGSVPPSDAVASLAAQLDALASRSFELSDLGLARPLQAQARLWLVGAAQDPLAPATLTLLRQAIGDVEGERHRRVLGQSFAVLARAAAAGGRADLWQDAVEMLDARLGPLMPRDLAWWVAGWARQVVRLDSRWFRAQRTREQAEALLAPALASGTPVEVERAEAVRVELGVAYALNRDHDERPFLDVLDEVTAGLIADLGTAPAREHILSRSAALALRAPSRPERISTALTAWLDAARARGPLGPELIEQYRSHLERLDAARDGTSPGQDSQGDAADLPPDAVPGVPAGLYSPHAGVRVRTLRSQFGAWAFMTANASEGDAFYEAVPILAELYTRGIADPVEDVREEAVVFARRLIYGYSHRGRNPDGMTWVRRVIADTAGMTSIRCHRAHVLALADYRTMDTDRLAILAANDRLDAALVGSQADYAICQRALLALWRMREMDDDDPDKVWASERVVPMLVESIDNDEYEQHDWPDLIRTQARWLMYRHIQAERWDDAFRNARTYAQWMDAEPDTEQLRVVGIYHLGEFAALAGDPASPHRDEALAMMDTARRILAKEDPDVLAIHEARATIQMAGATWGRDRSLALAEFDRGLGMGVRALPHDPDGTHQLASWMTAWGRWAFIEAERWDSGDHDGTERPYTDTARAALLYLRHRLHAIDPEAEAHTRDLVRLAAHPGTFLTSQSDDDVRELYALLVPLLDDRRDGADAAKVRELAKKAGRRGRGWFGR
ncbi:hypothetical protein G7070_15820 [Propioniciclava coleopterorum]|uniref:Uncharacterized protein n=1 Tax=Propioniciclava coleopterorum TaxID=2714937 RepID=A0A6G7Y9R1_9ACTN|nr:hypothetical protein [Propioniciclava coleopterorum]QIK73459.1 hypothetical protein G7070_15820 [Propioniciclava coleopterorum]